MTASRSLHRVSTVAARSSPPPAARSLRIEAAHAALSGEMRLFLLALRPHLDPPRLAADHKALAEDLEEHGPAALRDHLRIAAETLA